MPDIIYLSLLRGKLHEIAMQKTASTAFVRRIRQGLLSPQSITRVAQTMPDNKFRTIGYLGEGQFTLADRVVGNVGGYAGEMVRKMSNRLAPNYVAEGEKLKQLTDQFNRRMQHRRYGGTKDQTPLLAPIIESNPKGVFQHLSIGKVPMVHYADIPQSDMRRTLVENLPGYPDVAHANPRQWKALHRSFRDLHEGNYGVAGQIHDAQPNRKNLLLDSSIKTQFTRPIFGKTRAGRLHHRSLGDKRRANATRAVYSDNAIQQNAFDRRLLAMKISTDGQNIGEGWLARELQEAVDSAASQARQVARRDAYPRWLANFLDNVSDFRKRYRR